MKKIIALSTLIITTFISPNSFADEVWNSNLGKVVYANEIGNTAVWTYNDNGREGVIYIPHLAKVYTHRGSYDGYWAQNKSNIACDTKREGLNGKSTAYWGRFHIDFIDPDFPSRWQAKWGYCDKQPTNKWNGTPVTANAPLTKNNISTSFSQEIRFEKGKSSAYFERSLVRGESAYYHFIAQTGQILNLEVIAEEDNTVFTVYKPHYILTDADDFVDIEGETLNSASSYDQTNNWVGELPVSGKYLIVVSATRGNASYKLKISIQ